MTARSAFEEGIASEFLDAFLASPHGEARRQKLQRKLQRIADTAEFPVAIRAGVEVAYVLRQANQIETADALLAFVDAACKRAMVTAGNKATSSPRGP